MNNSLPAMVVLTLGVLSTSTTASEQMREILIYKDERTVIYTKISSTPLESYFSDNNPRPDFSRLIRILD
jgi:hypothetical protein